MILGADFEAQRTGVRWGVRTAKESGVIISTERSHEVR